MESHQLRLSRFLQFLVEFGFAFGRERRLDEVEVEQRVEDVEVPLGLARFNVDNRAGGRALDCVRGNVSDVADGVKTFLYVRRQLARGDDFLNLVEQVLILGARVVTEHSLQISPAESGAGFSAGIEHLARLDVILSVGIRDFGRHWPRVPTGVSHESPNHIFYAASLTIQRNDRSTTLRTLLVSDIPMPFVNYLTARELERLLRDWRVGRELVVNRGVAMWALHGAA